MKPLEVTQPNALKAFNSADANGKKMLTNLFGEEVFNQKITDRVKSFEDACDILGIDSKVILTIDVDSHNDSRAVAAFYKLTIIIRALNEGWKPNWDNSNEYKYYPYFKHKAGFGFSYTNFAYWYALTFVGSRLCLKSSELAMYAGQQFEAIYNDFLTL